ncbi:uncharacterized protein LOC111385746 [Olea europaea var. sylvestris]|uniref:uncharacterized protein LOC111385746 n=1 Tax=Olea europaea var. sylvestris TaxID=158386 RepID=UPI000C1D4F6B|nr:uncharacterized protein LOC111385746 [Olea europaea var. sylvestris]
MTFGVTIRRSNPSWFKEFSSWLEYSVEKDAAYCLYCYLFRTSSGKQGHSFRGHDESEDSLNPVDESHDVSIKEQMSIVLYYVDNSGHVDEHFIRIEHVTCTTALSLKAAIDKVFSRYNLSMSRLRGQGYDGASNMQDVLALIVEDESCSCDQRSDATNLLESIQKFDFAFNLQLMRNVLEMSNELSKALQRKYQDIVNAMQLRNSPEITNLHHYQVDLFYSVIDLQLQELNDRFSKVNTEFLCSRCHLLNDQLETYIFNMHSNKEFEGLNDLGDLAEKLVPTKKDKVYPLVYRLLTLALILPIATATVERVFSVMSIVKDRLCNRMGDQ